MYIYAVIDTRGELGTKIETLFGDTDRCQATDTVWFVRSDRITSSEVVSDLGIKAGELSGIVIRAAQYDGVAKRGIAEKLSAWEKD